MRMRSVSVSIAEKVAAEIETMARKSIEEVATELLNGFLHDGRRRQFRMIQLGISWPPDWYERMLAVWGENKVAPNVRRVLREFMMKDPHRGKSFVPSEVPELRNRLQQTVRRKPKLRIDGQTFVGQTLIPEDWAVWLEEQFPAKRSTYVKLAMYNEICTWPWPRGKSPSIPNGLLRFQDANF